MWASLFVLVPGKSIQYIYFAYYFRITPRALLGTVALTVVFIILARLVWRWGLKNYSGASA
jgi:ABC-type uncharacterized transport system permease subunit